MPEPTEQPQPVPQTVFQDAGEQAEETPETSEPPEAGSDEPTVAGGTAEATPPEGDTEQFDARRAQDKIRKANSEAANLRKRLKELEPLARKAKELEDAQKTEAERLQGQLAEVEQRLVQVRARAVRSEVRALAADTFADPTDPEAHLELGGYVGDDGEIDTDQIKTDLAGLLERKPHLGKPRPEPQRRPPAPDRTQASTANQSHTSNPAEQFAGFVTSRLKSRR